MARLAIACALAYAVGSFLFGPILARRRGVDLYAIGSGNPGATNVERALGRRAGITVLALDAAKGAAAVALARLLGLPDDAGPAMAGASAVLGHCFPITAPSRGGKGVATAVGVIAALEPLAGIAAAGVYLAARRISRYASVGSLAAIAVGVTVAALRAHSPIAQAALVAIAALIVARHGANLGRLLRGEEPRVGTPAPDLEED